jgi:photosystem II stability/assembly factor-like uncharacterized protein
MAVALSPAFASDHSVFAGVAGGILRSFDGGQNWQVAELPTPPPVVSTLAVSPNYAQDGTLFAGTLQDGVFRSADRGQSWAAWNFGLLDPNVFCIAISPDFARDETLFVGTETGIFQSTNGGRSWQEVDLDEYAPASSLALSPGFADDGLLWAGTETCGLLRSEDRGLSWARVGQDVITAAINQVILSPQYPARPDLLVLLGDALLISRDGGASWSDWQADLPQEGLVSVAAPQGLETGAPILVGLAEGDVLRL